MATGPRYKVPFRRRREGRTNYHLRLKLLLSRQDRVVVRKSARNIQIQLIAPTPDGDITYSSAVSSELAKYGYTASYGEYNSCIPHRVLVRAEELEERI